MVFLVFLWQNGSIRSAAVDYSINAFRNVLTSLCLLMPTAAALTEKNIVYRKLVSFCCSTFVQYNFCAGKNTVLNKTYLEINAREARRNWHKRKAKWLNKFLWSYPVQDFIILHSAVLDSSHAYFQTGLMWWNRLLTRMRPSVKWYLL